MAKNILIAFLMIAILAGGFVFPAHRAKASGILVWDPQLGVLQNLKNLWDLAWQAIQKNQMVIQIANQVKDLAAKVARWAREDLMRSIRDIVAKRIIDYIVDQTVQWIQGGGKPKFVTDWKGFLRDAGDIAFDSLAKDLEGKTGINICAPFALDIRIGLIPQARFPQEISCTLDKIVGNIENFYADFSKGGWIGYEESWYPANNYYGMQIVIADEYTRRLVEQQRASENEARAGSGYLNVRGKCLEPEYTTKITSEPYCVSEDPGGNCVSYGSINRHEKVETGCNKWETTTPGDTVGKSVATAITSDTYWAANIQSWTAALINAVINRVIKEGILGIKKFVTAGDDTNRTDYDPLSGTQYEQIVIDSFSAQRNEIIKEPQDYWKAIKDIADKKQASLDSAGRIKRALELMKSSSCPSPATDEEIQVAQAEINRLQAEVDVLEDSLLELENVIVSFSDADDEISMNQAITRASPILDKYRTAEFAQEITEGKPASEAERQDKNTALLAVQSRLTACTASTGTTTTSQ